MKKFLLFLVSIVVVVFVSLTTYYFMKNYEIITVEVKELYCNAGDVIYLEELGVERKKPHRKTTINYNAGGENVTKAIEFDGEKGAYVVKGEVAGDVQLIISTTNKKYPEFKINIHIGNGEKETPYYIFDNNDLAKIGTDYGLDKSYKLMSDISLTNEFIPVGFNYSTEKFEGFSGEFFGNGHTITGLNITEEYSSAGFFSSLNKGSKVESLNFNNANISGYFDNAGVLAGVVNGNISRITVQNSVVENLKEKGNTGSIAGVVNSSEIKLCAANNVTVNVGSLNSVLDYVNVGGFVGKLDNSTVKACYVNGSLNVYSTVKSVGGFVGIFLINDNTTSIQQSYASVATNSTEIASFIGVIDKSSKFIDGNKDVFYLIGNISVGKDNKIVNISDVQNSKNQRIFSSFYNVEKNKYLIYNYKTEEEFISAKELVFYAMSSTNKVLWDTEFIWNKSSSSLPTLKMGSFEPENPTSEYFQKDFTLNEIFDFATTFKTDRINEGFDLNEDVDLTSWRPVALTNCVLNGNNHTITVRLSNENNGNVGLFSVIDNCTIKNLNIVITGVVSAENVGALAGIVTSSDETVNSSINNVTVKYENKISNLNAINFGGLVGFAKRVNIKGVKVLHSEIEGDVNNLGGVVGTLQSGTIIDADVNVSISGSKNIGGIVAVNSGKIANSLVSATINVNNAQTNANIGGVVGSNIVLTEKVNEVDNVYGGIIASVNANVNISINSAANSVYVGGVAGVNEKEITNTVVTGKGVQVANVSASVCVGGVVSVNYGKVTLTQNKLENVGTYHVGRNVQTGGIAYQNKGEISKITVYSNVYGNYSAGLVVLMNSEKATIDQVYVASDEIKADKFAAGFVVNFRKGKITNVQAESTIIGAANYSVSSLVVLVFESGSQLKNATVNSSIIGYGTFYRETWTDFKNYSNKEEFGITSSFKIDGRYDICMPDEQHGSMQSIVFNGSCAGFDDAKFGRSSAFMGISDYDNSKQSSYVKVVDGFTDISQFIGKFEFLYAVSSWFKIKYYETKELTFVIGAEWVDNGSGINLSFLNEIK